MTENEQIRNSERRQVGGFRISSIECEMLDRIRQLQSMTEKAEAERDALREALIEYGVHESTCVLSHWRAGRPTADGGYECQFGEKWYSTRPIDNTPPCTCGLAEIEEERRDE